MEWRKKGKTDLEIKQQQRNEVLVRSIIKEAEYLMRCGRLYQAISSINRVLTNLPHYGLEIIDLANLLDPLHEVGGKKLFEQFSKMSTLSILISLFLEFVGNQSRGLLEAVHSGQGS